MPPAKKQMKKSSSPSQVHFCTVCGVSCSTLQNLKHHTDYTHLGIRYVCLICSTLCGQFKEFYRHREACAKDAKALLVIFSPGQEPLHVHGQERVLMRNLNVNIWQRCFNQPNFNISWLNQPINPNPLVPVQNVVVQPIAGPSGVVQTKQPKNGSTAAIGECDLLLI